MTPADPLTCTIKDLSSTQKTSFATTQAVWRFLNNEGVSSMMIGTLAILVTMVQAVQSTGGRLVRRLAHHR